MLHDIIHDMYLPDKRAERIVPRALIPDRYGNHEEKQLWMRDRQERLRLNPPRLQANRAPNSIIVKLAEQLKGVK
jgi:hypothetical protein